MLRPLHAVCFAVAVIALGGCCRDTIREMSSLKDVALHPQQRSAKGAPDRPAKSAEVDRDDRDDRDDAKQIETGSVDKPIDCQGPHIAYQATKEYLKNFGPRPPDQPGEKGPCKAEAQ